jgi:hypothetical protein
MERQERDELASIARGLFMGSGAVGSARALSSIERLVTWWRTDAVANQSASSLRVFLSSLVITPITFTFTFARSPSCMDASLTSPVTVTLNALGLIGSCALWRPLHCCVFWPWVPDRHLHSAEHEASKNRAHDCVAFGGRAEAAYSCEH